MMATELDRIRLAAGPLTNEAARAALAQAEPIVRRHRAREERIATATGAVLAAIVDAGPDGLPVDLGSASTATVVAAVAFAVEALDNAGLLAGMEDTDGI